MNATQKWIQTGCGRGRNPWAIRAYLSMLVDENGHRVNMSTVAAWADTYPQVAQETVRGTRNHRRVLAVLTALGCPQEHLYGPDSSGRKGIAA